MNIYLFGLIVLIPLYESVMSSPLTNNSTSPSLNPSPMPSANPSVMPSANPSPMPSASPSTRPTRHPSTRPTRRPSSQPSAQPSSEPSGKPSAITTDYTWIIIGIVGGTIAGTVAIYKVYNIYNAYMCREKPGPLTNKPCTAIDLDERAYLL